MAESYARSAAHIHKQYVWGLRYIDAPVLRDRETDGGAAGLDERLYYTQDGNFNVTALVNPAGQVVERYSYDAYGQVTVLDGDWSVDADGLSDVDNAILYCGYRFDSETGLYHVRHRYLHPTLGRWTTQDPLGYVDGMGLYEYCRSESQMGHDPSGMLTDDERMAIQAVDSMLNDGSSSPHAVARAANTQSGAKPGDSSHVTAREVREYIDTENKEIDSPYSKFPKPNEKKKECFNKKKFEKAKTAEEEITKAMLKVMEDFYYDKALPAIGEAEADAIDDVRKSWSGWAAPGGVALVQAAAGLQEAAATGWYYGMRMRIIGEHFLRVAEARRAATKMVPCTEDCPKGYREVKE